MRRTNRRATRVDSRTTRTRRALQDALIELIKAKQYELITVQDITEQAQLSRATFYLHYNDKDTLFAESMHDLLDDVIDEISAVTVSTPLTDLLPTQALFQLVDRNCENFRILLTGDSSAKLLVGIRHRLTAGFQQRFEQLYAHTSESAVQARPIELLAGYSANALIGLITWWLENQSTISAEAVAEMARHLTLFGVMPTLMQETV